MENFDALDVIARTRGKVEMDDVPTGNTLFLLWGWLTAALVLASFLLWLWLRQEWCLWVWLAAPLVGVPWMMHIVRKDHDRSHKRTRDARMVLDCWILVGGACCAGGFLTGFSGLDRVCLLPLVGLLIGIGCFVTGEVLRFRPKIVGGVVGAGIALVSVLFQGDAWIWQYPALSLVAVVSLVLPGYLYNRQIAN